MASEKPVITYDETKKADAKRINRWWTIQEKDKVHEHLFPLVQEIEQRQQYQRVRNLRHARLYSNLEIFGLQAGLFTRSAQQALVNNRVTFNIVKSCIDTAAAKIAKMKPRPMFLTIKGSEEQQRNAQNLTLFMDGAFETAKLYPNMQRGFVDGGVFGDGLTKLYREGNKILSERTLVDEIIVDDVEGIYGDPLTLYQSKFVSRDTLCELFPKYVDQIRAAQVGMVGDWYGTQEFDRIRVIEAWKKPSAIGATDGRHTIVISNATLVPLEDYKKRYFPFIHQRWNHKITGWHGCGLAEELIGIQLEINKLLKTVQIAQHLMCVPRIWIENNSMVDAAHINNDVATIGKYTGSPPVATSWPAMPPEIYQHIENLVRKAYEITGISMLSAQSKKPQGLDSGIAIREYLDNESERFQLVSMRYEDAHMEGADMMVDMYRDMKKAGVKDVGVKAVDGKWVQDIEWEKLDLDESKSVMRAFPTSILPTQPAAKLAKIQELMQAGLIDKETGLKLLDMPDVEGAMSLRLAAMNNAEEMVARILEDGKAITPEPFMNLEIAKQVAQNSYLKAQINGVSEPKLELLRQFINNCQAGIDEAAAAAQAGSQAVPQPQGPGAAPGSEAGGGQPMAQPAAPPVSDLIPNVPGA